GLSGRLDTETKPRFRRISLRVPNLYHRRIVLLSELFAISRDFLFLVTVADRRQSLRHNARRYHSITSPSPWADCPLACFRATVGPVPVRHWLLVRLSLPAGPFRRHRQRQFADAPHRSGAAHRHRPLLQPEIPPSNPSYTAPGQQLCL